MSELRQKVFKGVIWASLEKFGLQIVSFVVSMVLSRLLTPEDYGTVALMSIFLAVAGLLVDGGFGAALIQKKNATEMDYNSVFYLHLAVSAVVYAALFFAAPSIARFYNVAALTPMVRIASFQFIFGAINSIQGAEIAKKLQFNLSFRVSVITSGVSAVVGITLAFLGWGPWALIWSSFASGLIGVIARWFIVAWRPRLMFSFTALKSLFSFGWKVVITQLIYSVSTQLYGLLIGKLYSRADLAFFNKGRAMPNLVKDTVHTVLARVSFPMFALIQDNPSKVRSVMRELIRTSTLIVYPLLMLLAASAPSAIRVLFGDQWDASVPYVQLFCLSFAFAPLDNTNLQVVLASGRSGLYLKLELIKDFLLICWLVSVFRLGVFAFACALVLGQGPLCVIINAWPLRKICQYSLLQELRDVLPVVLTTTFMGAIVWGLGLLLAGESPTFSHSLFVFLVQSVTGLLVYISVVWLVRLGAVADILRILPPRLYNRFPRFMATMKRHFA